MSVVLTLLVKWAALSSLKATPSSCGRCTPWNTTSLLRLARLEVLKGSGFLCLFLPPGLHQRKGRAPAMGRREIACRLLHQARQLRFIHQLEQARFERSRKLDG